MVRFQVIRKEVKYKGRMYKCGELLPEQFTERDRCRNLYPSRVAMVTIEDEPKVEAKNEDSIKAIPEVVQTTPGNSAIQSLSASPKGNTPAQASPLVKATTGTQTPRK